MNLRGKQITVVGLGKSGFAALEFLQKQGAKARATEVFAKDSVACLAEKLTRLGIEVELGGHTAGFLKGSRLVVTSPGVPDTALPIKWAKRNKIKVIDEIELAYRFCKPPIIAVTGTNGKSTTTSLIGHIFAKSKENPVVCGNIGDPFSGKLANLKKCSVIVLEASSFQLSRIDKFRPRIAVFLNATQNHLDRHADFEDYFNAKMRIFKNQSVGDWAVINYEDKNLLKNAGRIRAKKIFFSPEYKNFKAKKISNFASVDAGRLFVKIKDKKIDICSTDVLKIKGRHNLENALAAIAAACAFGISPRITAGALGTFRGLEHRCEEVAVIDGVRFINDSKSTTPDAAIKALNLCRGRVVMIAGGRDKNADFAPVKKYVRDKVRALILIGEAKDKIKNVLAGATDIRQADSLQDAARLALNLAKKGDDVLLSPMCTSFDMFQDFEHRGRVFKDSVKRLEGQPLHSSCARPE